MSYILLMELNKHLAVYGTLLQVCVCEFISPFPAICSGECVYISAEGGWAQGGLEASDLYIRLGHMSLITECQGERSEV